MAHGWTRSIRASTANAPEENKNKIRESNKFLKIREQKSRRADTEWKLILPSRIIRSFLYSSSGRGGGGGAGRNLFSVRSTDEERRAAISWRAGVNKKRKEKRSSICQLWSVLIIIFYSCSLIFFGSTPYAPVCFTCFYGGRGVAGKFY